MPESDTLVKWDIFMGESEDWEVLRKLRKMGEAIRNFSHLSTKSAKKFKFYAKFFDQLATHLIKNKD